MFNLVGKRNWFFLISALVIIAGLVAMGISVARFGSPIRLSIDFTSGSLLEVRFDQPVLPGEVREVVESQGIQDPRVQTAGDGQTVIIRTKPIDTEAKAALEGALQERFGPLSEQRFETVGPAIGREVTRAAVGAVAAASLAILGFIVFAFRKVPNAFRYGVCALAGMLHDILVSLGLFSLMGLLLGWEADALFLTALLTVIGFSVQDKIVVFDRIRENVPKRRGEPYEQVVNRSLLETMHRSLATQLNAIFVMIAILLFGGATLQQFIAVLLIGMLSGTYSSLFSAVPLLVVWENGDIGRFFARLRGQRAAPAQ